MNQFSSTERSVERAAADNDMTDPLQQSTVSRHYVDSILASMSDALIATEPVYSDTSHQTVHAVISVGNHAAAALFGIPTEALTGLAVESLITHAEPQKESWLHQLLLHGHLSEVELVAHRKNGDTVPVMLSGSQLRGKDGSLGGVVCVLRDITEVKERERELQDSDDRFRSLYEATFEGLLIHDQGTILDTNGAACQLLGYDMAEVIGMSVLDVFAPEKRQNLRTILAEITGQPGTCTVFETTALRKDGTTFPIAVRGKELTYCRRQVRVMTFLDITERKQKEEALQYRLDFEDLITRISTQFIHMAPEELQDGIHSALRQFGEFVKADHCFVIPIIEGRVPALWYDWHPPEVPDVFDRIKTLDMTQFPWWVRQLETRHNIPIADVDQLPEEARREQEFIASLGFKSIVCVPMIYRQQLRGFFGVSMISEPRSWNDDVLNLLTIVGQIFVNVLAQEEVQRALLESKEELERKVKERTRELQDKQSQLIQSEKMASLGQLVAGVAHEINTPLGAMKSNNDVIGRTLSRLRSRLDDSGDAQLMKWLDSMEKLNAIDRTAAERIAKIVHSLRTFARLDRAEQDTVDLHEGIESTLTLVHHRLKNRITVHREYGTLPLITCYPNQLNQVFMNILVNASQAIAGDGDIYIRTAMRGDCAIVEFRDTGKGIAPDVARQIFDPGFTTKGVGVGTGLGLSIVYQIIQDHGGDIEVESAPGEGATFRILLPTGMQG